MRMTEIAWSSWIVPVGAGICLAAACGFRTFLPLLALGLSAHFGLTPIADSQRWMAGTVGLVLLGTATVVEIAAYYVPLVDHLLDALATPLAALAGVLAMFTTLDGEFGILGWVLATIVGGGVASAFQLSTVKARALSTGTTGGLGNPVVATVEVAGSAALALIAVLVPVVATVVAVLLLVACVRVVRWLVSRRSAGRPPSASLSRS
jgi:hypothetical protein